MKKSESNKIIKFASALSDEELEDKYYDLVYESLGSQTDIMYELGYDMVDIIERQKYEKFIREECDLIGELCEKRGIKLWAHYGSLVIL